MSGGSPDDEFLLGVYLLIFIIILITYFHYTASDCDAFSLFLFPQPFMLKMQSAFWMISMGLGANGSFNEPFIHRRR